MSQELRWHLDESVVERVRAWAVAVDAVQVVDDGIAYQRLSALALERGVAAAESSIGEVEGINVARRLYRSFGVDPTRNRPSSEALMRRARKGQELYRISNLVDVGNWVSLEFMVPLGLYDRDQIEGDHAVVRTGHEAEEYEGIRKGPVHLGGRLCVSDPMGAFGSPTSDSARTCIGEMTRNVAAIVFAPIDVESERLSDAGAALASRLAEYGGGSVVVCEEIRSSPGSSG